MLSHAKPILPGSKHYVGSSLVLLFAVSIGCENVPPLPRKIDMNPIAGDTTSSKGRGGYDWIEKNGEFTIVPPSDLDVFQRIDRELVRSNYEKTRTNVLDSSQPEGMDEDVYYTIRRLTEPYTNTDPILSIPFQSKSLGMYSIHVSGEKLVTVGSQLEVWDLRSLKRLTSVSMPITKCRKVVWDSNLDHILLIDDTSVYRVEASSGKTLKTWKPPNSDEPLNLVKAAQSSNYAVATKNRRLFVLDENLQTAFTFSGSPVDNEMVAIHPNAHWVHCISRGEVIRWHIAANREKTETLYKTTNRGPLLFALAGSTSSFLATAQQCIVSMPGEDDKTRTIELEINPRQHAAIVGLTDQNGEWTTHCLSRPDDSGNRRFFLQDLHLMSGEASVEFPLGMDVILELDADLSTEVVAVRTAKEIRLHRRQRWKDATSRWTLDRLSNLAMDGRFDQLELAATHLKKQPRLRREYGETFYAYLAREIGQRWAYQEADAQLAETNSKQVDSIESKLEEWKSKGSELSILASCYRHSFLAQQARGTGYANTVTRAGWNEQEKRHFLIDSEVKPLLTKSTPSFAALEIALASRLSAGNSPKQLTNLLKQQIELYPNSDSVPYSMCIYMLPRWGGTGGEGGAYLATLADLLPKPGGDLLYSKVAIRISQTHATLLDSKEAGISVPRVQQTIHRCDDLSEFSQESIEHFMLRLVGTFQILDKVADYHVRNYAFYKSQETDFGRVPELRNRIKNAIARMNQSEK